MRIIYSTVMGGASELDRADAAVVEDLIGKAVAGYLPGRRLRESYTLVRGQKDYHAALVSYITPDGAERFAVMSEDPNNIEYFDSDDRDTANAAYETAVRDYAECAGDGEAWWQHTDVAGVPQRNDEDED